MIFKDKLGLVSSIIKLILKQLKDTIHILGRVSSENPRGNREGSILEKLELQIHLPQTLYRSPSITQKERLFGNTLHKFF